MTTSNPTWQAQNPIDAIVFDCDGTLSKLEGIDELAQFTGAGEAVKTLTANAMTHTGLNPTLYQTRLELVQPHQDHLIALGQRYFEEQVPDAAAVIQILLRLQKNVYLVSAGLLPSVLAFGNLLHVPQNNIYAVDIQFDSKGCYQDFDRASPLIHAQGKRQIIQELKKQHTSIAHIGDGLNDYVVYDLVTRFIGFGGVFFRKNIADQCHYYIQALSLAPLLPLLLTALETELLNPNEIALYQKGLAYIIEQQVSIKETSPSY